MPNGIVKNNGILSEGKKVQTPLITNVKFEKNGNLWYFIEIVLEENMTNCINVFILLHGC